jgi:hypothetical protein
MKFTSWMWSLCSVFKFARNRVAQMGSLSTVFYNQQGFSGGIQSASIWTFVSQNQSYVTTDGQSGLVSSPFTDLRLDFRCCQTVRGLLMWVLSDEWTFQWFKLPLIPASVVFFGSDTRGIHDHILLPQFRDISNLEGQVPINVSLLCFSPSRSQSYFTTNSQPASPS